MLAQLVHAARRLAHRLIGYWMELQVELHGQYSPQRVRALHDYCVKTPWWRATLVCLLTPFPCLLLVILTDAIPLADPKSGILNNYVYWCRNTVGCAFISLTVLEQFHGCLPRLGLNTRTILFISVTSTSLTTFFQMGCASLIGFPLPFTFFFAVMVWAPAIILQLLYVTRQVLRQDASLRADFFRYCIVFFCQVSLTVIYPAYMSIFVGLEGVAQTAFFLVLPLIKLVTKNWISRFLPENGDDVKPEVIIFNIEIFHALYISCALQNVTSTAATVMIMVLDLALVWIAILDVNAVLNEIKTVLARMQPQMALQETSLIRICMEVLEDPAVANDPRFLTKRGSILRSMSSRIRSFTPPAARIAVASAPTEELTRYSASSSSPTVEDIKAGTLDASKRVDDKLVFVTKLSQVLFMTEFAILIEFAEVVVPVMYSTFLSAMSHLPNRAYYPQLALQSQSQLIATVLNVFLYSALEFLSFVSITMLLKRKLRLSTLHQLAFVLETQWVLVQSKLILWTFFVIESSIFHFGTDFSFKFAWLHAK